MGSSKKINSNYNGQFNSTNKDPTDLKTAQKFPNSIFFNTLVFPPILLKIACKRDTLSLNLANVSPKVSGKNSLGLFIQVYVLGTRPRQNVLGTSSRYTSVQTASTVKCSRYPLRSDLKSAHISVCTVWLIVYTLRNVWGHFNGHSPLLIAVCVLSPAHFIEPVLGFTSFRLHFGGVLRGRFVPRTWFDRVPAGTVLAGTWLFRTRSDYKIWCVSRNMFPLYPCTEN